MQGASLYLNCRDCGDARSLIQREHDDDESLEQGGPSTLGDWLSAHLDGRCDGAMHRNAGREIPDDGRLYLSRRHPGPGYIVPPPVDPSAWRWSWRGLNERAFRGDDEAIDALLSTTGTPGRAYRQAMEGRADGHVGPSCPGGRPADLPPGESDAP